MSPILIGLRPSPIVGFSYFSPKYHAGPASCTPSAPAITDSVCAEFGLEWLKRSLRQILKASEADVFPCRKAPP